MSIRAAFCVMEPRRCAGNLDNAHPNNPTTIHHNNLLWYVYSEESTLDHCRSIDEAPGCLRRNLFEAFVYHSILCDDLNSCFGAAAIRLGASGNHTRALSLEAWWIRRLLGSLPATSQRRKGMVEPGQICRSIAAQKRVRACARRELEVRGRRLSQ